MKVSQGDDQRRSWTALHIDIAGRHTIQQAQWIWI
jgi:hypothetical protein